MRPTISFPSPWSWTASTTQSNAAPQSSSRGEPVPRGLTALVPQVNLVWARNQPEALSRIDPVRVVDRVVEI